MQCGTDIVNVDRVRKSIEELGDKFKKRIYTDEEINYCESRRMCKYESYAARFAAKEAVYKAISPELEQNGVFTEVEVLNKENGKPYVVLHGELKKIMGDRKIDISLSHEKEFAVAVAIVE
ncbi:MAG: holo-ACP synthase [Clostridia bacterium]|nr:holo-ACP synthase [Clostridia bacterium]